ncbi:mitochondrial lysine-tRNA synthetase [Exophiala dermatitidis]|nr:mitochondrial lysine-tRNA synthetase [Exophiala dermatitidis]KAJ4545559.1 mitochondrial lysine-tRNA synthetase [Exophiala dermatitidis]
MAYMATHQSTMHKLLRNPAGDGYLSRIQHHERVALPTLHKRTQAGFATVAAPKLEPTNHSGTTLQCSNKEARERAEELKSCAAELYPRYKRHGQARSIRSLLEEETGIDGSPGPEYIEGKLVSGRITSIRLSGSKLAFVDIVEDQLRLQVVLSYSALTESGVSLDEFKHSCRLIRRGDHISIQGGQPYRAKNGQLSIKATSLPILESPCLQRFPVEQRGFATSPLSETNYQPRHVEMLTDPEVVETLKARSALVRAMRQFFEARSFVEVDTPILSALAGGATAKPFETTATEFPDRKLSLRIAPELWLKRLIVGGMERIFEIGPSFRNEGLDKTHNPEFTTCEFYAVRHDLPQLMELTKQLLSNIAQTIKGLPGNGPLGRNPEELTNILASVQQPYQEIDFILTLNEILGLDLPNLSAREAQSQLIEIFNSKNIPLPSNPTVPRLMDKLCSVYIEPRSADNNRPIWIVNIPECLSPLAKSFIHPTAPNEQPVAARAELFIRGREVVNCYEEENSPFEQRRKFQDQQRYARQFARTTVSDNRQKEKDHDNALDRVQKSKEQLLDIDEEAMKVDEDYLEALEWGLPPTGGWGCGIDRLVMLFTGNERIGDVLSFGNLRAVTRGAEKIKQEE